MDRPIWWYFIEKQMNVYVCYVENRSTASLIDFIMYLVIFVKHYEIGYVD